MDVCQIPQVNTEQCSPEEFMEFHITTRLFSLLNYIFITRTYFVYNFEQNKCLILICYVTCILELSDCMHVYYPYFFYEALVKHRIPLTQTSYKHYLIKLASVGFGIGSGNHVTKSKSTQTHVLFRMIISLFSTSCVALS